MKKIFLAIVHLALALSVVSVAQGQVTQDNSEPAMTIRDVATSYDSQSQTLTINYKLINETESFIDDLQSNVSLLKGDTLSSEGSLYANAEFILNQVRPVNKIDPMTSVSSEIKITLPKNISAANHFVVLTIANEDGSTSASWYMEKPIALQGAGGFIPLPAVKVLYNGALEELLEGAEQKNTESLQLAFTSGTSKEFDAFIAKGGSASVNAKVYSLQGESAEPVATFTKIQLKSSTAAGQKVWVAELPIWADAKSGPYEVKFDAVNNATSEAIGFESLSARWLIDGFTVRIGEVYSGTNIIRKGDKVDVSATLFSHKGADQAGKVKVAFISQGQTVFETEKAVSFGTEEQLVNFIDTEVPDINKAKVDKIAVTVLDSTGAVLDSHALDVASEKTFDRLATNYVWIVIIALIVLIAIVWFIIHRRRGGKMKSIETATIVLMLVFAGLGALNIGNSDAYSTNCGRDFNNAMCVTDTHVNVAKSQSELKTGPTDTNNGPTGNLGACPQTVTVFYSAYHVCARCANGIVIYTHVNKDIFNSVTATTRIRQDNTPSVTSGFNAGMANSFGTGPRSHTFTLTSAEPKVAYSVTADSTKEGHGFCSGSTKTSAVHTVTCTAVPNEVTGLTATPGATCGTGVNLAWQHTNNAVVADGFKIYRSASVDGTYTVVATVANPAARSHPEVSAAGGVFYFKVSSYKGALESPLSAAVSATAPAACPTASGLSCTTTRSADKKTITWNATVTAGALTDYNFNWTGDVTATNQQTVTKTYPDVGPYRATLTATHKTSGITDTFECKADAGCEPGTIWCQVTKACIPEGSTCGSGPGTPICPTGQVYCPVTNSCIGAGTTCGGNGGCPGGNCGGGPSSPVCGTRTFVAAGGTLTNPTVLNYPGDLSPVERRNKLDTAAQFSLCAPGSELTPGSLFVNAGESKWYWTCKQIGVTGGASVSCDAACLPGTTYNPIKGYCAVDCPDWCPNLPGLQPTRSNYLIDSAGNCPLPTGRIVYFRANPDTASSSCPAFWKTEAGLGARMDCRLNNVSEVDFPANKLEGGPGRLIEAGKRHTLTCDLRLTDDNSLVKTLTATTRCYKIGDVKEQ